MVNDHANTHSPATGFITLVNTQNTGMETDGYLIPFNCSKVI